MLIDEIRSGESATLEFKLMPNRESERWLKTVVAFANCKGGRIVFRVSNDRKVVGVDGVVVALKDSIVDAVADACAPNPLVHVDVETVEGHSLLVLTVAQGRSCPYYLKAGGLQDGVYVRYDATTRKAEPDTIQELQLDGVGKGYDAVECRGLQVEDFAVEALCRRMYEEAVENALTDEQRKAIKPVTRAQLRKWGVLIPKGGTDVASNAYALLIGDELIAPKVKCALFKGTDRSIFIDRRPLGGSVIDQIKESYKWVLSKLNLSAHFVGLKRVDTYEIPPSAIRELIVNAVLHRSYVDASASPISVALYDDRFEITSPGSLPRGMTIEKMLQGESICRNKVLAEALAYMFLIENWGSGMLRIQGDLEGARLSPVEVVDFGSSLRFIVKRALTNKSQINPDKTQINPDKKSRCGVISRIVKEIRGNPAISIPKLSKLSGRTYDEVRGILVKLREFKILTRTGARKNGRWIVADWVNDEVLEIEDKGLQPVRIGKNGKVEVMMDLDLSKQPELYAKLEIMAKKEGKPIEEIVREIVEKAVGI